MFNFSLNGVAEYFILGKQGPKIKKDADKIQFRNHADDDFINIQALDPVDPQDMVTLQYFENNSSNLPFNSDGTLHSIIDFNSGTQQIGINDIPDKALVYQIQVEVTEVWDDALATLDIGDSTTNDRLMNENQVCLDKLGLYVIETCDIYTATDTINAYLSNGSATTGSAEVTVLYTISEDEVIGGTPVLIEQLLEPNQLSLSNDAERFGQTVTLASDTNITSIEFAMSQGTPTPSATGDVYIKIFDVPNGTLIATSDAVDITTFPAYPPVASSMATFNFSGLPLVSAGSFYWEVDFTGVTNAPNGMFFKYDSSTDPYAGGGMYYNGNPYGANSDLTFRVNGVEAIIPVTSILPKNDVVSASNDISSASYKVGQSFKLLTVSDITSIKLMLSVQTGSPTGSVNINLYEVDNGKLFNTSTKSSIAISTNSLDVTTLTATPQEVEFTFTGLTALDSSKSYKFELQSAGDFFADGSNRLSYSYSVNNEYPLGVLFSNTDSTSSYDNELTFEVLGTSTDISATAHLFDNTLASVNSTVHSEDLGITVTDAGTPTGQTMRSVFLDKFIASSASGKYYLEVAYDRAYWNLCVGVRVDNSDPTVFDKNGFVGIFDTATSAGQSFWIGNSGGGQQLSFVGNSNSGTFNSGLSSMAEGDRITIAIDMDNNKVWFGLNGSFGAGDPLTNSGGLSLQKSLGSTIRIGCSIAQGGGYGGADQASINTKPAHTLAGFTYLMD